MGAAERLDPESYIPELDFLQRERRSPFRHEYYQGVVTAMSGAGYRHNVVSTNLVLALGKRLPAHCRPNGSDLRVHSPITSFYTYPDVLVICGKPEFLDAEFDTLLNPSLIAEVLSPSTRQYDLTEKATRYRAIVSLQHYLLIDPATPFVQLHTRTDRPGQWLITDLTELAATLQLTAFGIEIPVLELYEGIEFAPSSLRLS
jgi:Uma2 family endonuclease